MLWIALIACQSKLITIRVEDTVTAEVPAGSLLDGLTGDLGFDDFLDMDITESAALRNQGVEPGDITSARFEAFDLTATDPSGSDLSFMQMMALSVEAPDVAEVRFASADSFPEGEPKVEFELDDVDILPHVVSQSMTITTSVTGHRPEQTTTIDAHFILAVGVTFQGATGEL